MQPIGNYQTLLQLAVGLNLVIGGYGKIRTDLEKEIEDELIKARGQMDEILPRRENNAPIDHGFHKRPIKELDDRHLSRYLSDVTIRYFHRSEKARSRDAVINPALIIIGVFSLLCLCYASIWPKTLIPMLWVYLLVFVFVGCPVGAFILANIEARTHALYRRRELNDSAKEKFRDNHAKRIKTDPIGGEISRVTNRIRVRYADLQRASARDV